MVTGDLSPAVAIFATMQGWHDDLRLTESDVSSGTIFIDTGGVKVTDFGLSQAARERRFESGRSASADFLSTRSMDLATG